MRPFKAFYFRAYDCKNLVSGLFLACMSLVFMSFTSCSSNANVNADNNANANGDEYSLVDTLPANSLIPDSKNPWKDDLQWLRAYPLGNGSLGAMVFGDVNQERIQLNEESMWSGSCQLNADNPEAALALPKIRQMLFDGKYKEAEALVRKTQICRGPGSGFGAGANDLYGSYQTLGDLRFSFDKNSSNTCSYTNYKRELNLSDAVVRVAYEKNGVRYKREIFVSQPDQVMVVHLTASKKVLNFSCSLSRPELINEGDSHSSKNSISTYAQDDELVMKGHLSSGAGAERAERAEKSTGLKYIARLKAKSKTGKITCDGDRLYVNGSNDVVLLLAASTDYLQEYPIYKGRDYESITTRRIDKAAKMSYDKLYKRHCAEYSQYYNRVRFSLNQTDSQDSLALVSLLFQYGRYLLIASSRPGTLPANLQGLWAAKVQNPWNADYHTNINLQMNYWPAEVCNLSEMHMPYFKLLSSLALPSEQVKYGQVKSEQKLAPGQKTARIQYGMKGWVTHPITNVWGFTSPGEQSSWGLHTAAGAWLCTHIMEHYRFTKDNKFLVEMYPVLKGSVEFYMDWLVRDPHSGLLVSGPAGSPENSFYAPDGSVCQISMGPSHDQEVIGQLFADFLEASEVLAPQKVLDNEFISKVAQAKAELKPVQIGDDGRLMEWAEQFKEVEPGHRHISHLFSFYPGNEINLIQTPELATAVTKSLDYRIAHGGGHTGWSAAWLICQYARMHRAEKALASLNKIIEKNLFPNLFASHPPFQIDANFGMTAGIAEMLLQSHVYDREEGYIIELLPALPKSWRNGEVSGLKARGNITISMKWQDGKLQDYKVAAPKGVKYKVMYNNEIL